MAALRAILCVIGLLMVVIAPATGGPGHATHAVTSVVGTPCAHDTADHAPAAACLRGMAACPNHCPQVPQTAFALGPLAVASRPPFIRDIAGRDQDGPTRHLPPPKLLS